MFHNVSVSTSLVQMAENALKTEQRDGWIKWGTKVLCRTLTDTVLTVAALIETLVTSLLTILASPLKFFDKTKNIFTILKDRAIDALSATRNAGKGIFGFNSYQLEETGRNKQPSQEKKESTHNLSVSTSLVQMAENALKTEQRDGWIKWGTKVLCRTLTDTVLTVAALIETLVTSLLTILASPLKFFDKTEHLFTTLKDRTVDSFSGMKNAGKGIFGFNSYQLEKGQKETPEIEKEKIDQRAKPEIEKEKIDQRAKPETLLKIAVACGTIGLIIGANVLFPSIKPAIVAIAEKSPKNLMDTISFSAQKSPKTLMDTISFSAQVLGCMTVWAVVFIGGIQHLADPSP